MYGKGDSEEGEGAVTRVSTRQIVTGTERPTKKTRVVTGARSPRPPPGSRTVIVVVPSLT